MRISALESLTLAALFLVSVCGCGGSGEVPASALIPIKGKVTYQGKPLTKGMVVFEPVDYGRVASGPIQSDGTFVLHTKDVEGVVAGRHKVSISDESAGSADKRKKPPVPTKYASPNTSTLEAEVSKEKTEFTFDLK